MYKTAVLGDKDSILGFKALGVDVFHDYEEKTPDLIDRLVKEGYAVIFITEELVKKAEAAFEKYADSPLPAIIPIPGNRGSLGIGIMNMRKAAEKAIGADILFKHK
jgi:V/A-type H+/Na+-transporting ATPase subunit F